jgi:hypothetical protein
LFADYAYIIDWQNENAPGIFYVFDRVHQTRKRFNDWKLFLAEIENIPNGSELDHISRCSSPFDYAMPEENRDQLALLLTRKHFTYLDPDDLGRHVNFCFCETSKVVVLAETDR